MRFSAPIAVTSLALVAASCPSLVIGAQPRDLEDAIAHQAFHAANYGAHQAVDAAVYSKHQVKHAGKGRKGKGHSADKYAHDQAQSAEDYANEQLNDDDDDDYDDDDDSDDADEGEAGREQGAASEEYAQEQADEAQEYAANVAAHHNGGRGPSRHKTHKTASIYGYDYTPGVVASASHWLETKTAAYAYPRALSTSAAPSGADGGRHGVPGQGGNGGGFSLYPFASSYAGLPQYSGKNDRFASATARAKPAYGQQQGPFTVPNRQAASPSASSSAVGTGTTPLPSGSLTKRYGAYQDIGDVAASHGTQQATDAVQSVSYMLYGGDYAYGLGKRQPTPSPTTTAAAEPTTDKETQTNAATVNGQVGAPYYGVAVAVFAGAFL